MRDYRCVAKRGFSGVLAAVLTASLLLGAVLAFDALPAEAATAPKAPTNCRFVRWNITDFSECLVKWNKVSNADGYQTRWSWTDGTNAKLQTWSKAADGVVFSVPNNRASMVKVRAYRNSGSKKKYSAWSKLAYIRPAVANCTFRMVRGTTDFQEKMTWTSIAGCLGYRIYMATDPKGKWYLEKTLSGSSRHTAVIRTFRKKALKTGVNYYFKIVPYYKKGSSTMNAPLPSSDYWLGYFWFKS